MAQCRGTTLHNAGITIAGTADGMMQEWGPGSPVTGVT